MPIEGQSSAKVEKLVFRMSRVTARLPFIVPKPTNPFSSTLLLTYGFAGLIILGGGLLMLPISSSSGHFTSPIDALFTANSAICVTGLAVVDTGNYWSPLGQGILLVLCQIGGLGFISAVTLLLLAINRRFGLKERLAVTEAIGVDQLGETIGIVVKIVIFSLVVEGIGTVIFYFGGLKASGTAAPLWASIFHAVSAFNNCGFDILGGHTSFLGYQTNTAVLLGTAILVIIGSTGYVVIADLLSKRSFIKLSLDSKIVLVTTFLLLATGTLVFLSIEYSNSSTLGALSFPHKLLVSFFQSVTPRTAGFAAIDIGSLRQSSLLFTMFLMMIGGGVGSTAGGIKVNTLGVLWITIRSVMQGKTTINTFGRQITQQTAYRAIALFILYLGIIGIAVLILSLTEVFPIDRIFFEAFSALSNTGLTTGITPDLSAAGKLIIMATMFIGRLGPIALMVIIARRQQPTILEYPREAVRLG